MSAFDEIGKLAKDAESEAKQHPQEAEKLLHEGEQAADKRTGGRYDKELSAGERKLDESLGAGGGPTQQGSAQQDAADR